MSNNLVVNALAAHESLRSQIAENSSRSGAHEEFHDTTGRGGCRSARPVEFTVEFLEKPILSSGWELAEGSLVDGDFPVVSVGVERWVRSDRGTYTGAHLVFQVGTVGASYRITHHLTFRGLASKRIAAFTRLS